MKTTTLLLALLLSTFITSGCVGTHITSFKDPAYAGPSFKKILVFANFASLEARVDFEKTFAEELVYRNVWADGAYVYLPPFKDYSDSEIVAMSKKNGVDGWLILEPGSSSTVSVTNYGNSKSRTSVSADELNSMGTEIVLCRACSDKPLYRAETRTEIYRLNGKTIATNYDVIASAASNVADDLVDDSLVTPTM